MTIASFSKTMWDYYTRNGRILAWREDVTPYRVVVSEIMLQQTQVTRVAVKFNPFLKKFPDFAALAKAPTIEVLREWQGLGYNRRGLNLQRLAKIVTEKYNGKLPKTYEELLELPGIGPNTAGSIMAFAFNIPRAFIETNIRSVYIHFFFPEVEKAEGRKACKKISDDQLIPLIEKSIAPKTKAFAEPREWYYALMDYGSNLKRTLPNPSRRSAHHMRQSKFEGSNRQLRSYILRFVMEKPRNASDIENKFSGAQFASEMVSKNIGDLVKEGFIKKEKNKYLVA
jgi:A/G-specific adenine glycosylase